MAKIFISFLGTNPYLHCKYELSKKNISEPVRYVQEALASSICKKWNKDDKFLVFATEGENGSIKRNWEKGSVSSFDSKGQDFEKEPTGLETRLKRLSLDCHIDMIPISDGTQDGEIWSIINAIIQNIPEKSELYFDITHSFRYIPMIIPSIISFLKTTKETKLKSIYYGAFEVLGSNKDVCSIEIENRVAPIRELKELYNMIEWSEAVNSFIKFGDERNLIDEIDTIDNSTLDKKLKGQLQTTKSNIKKLGTALRFNDVSGLSKIQNVKISTRINLDNNPELLALKEISTKIEKHLSIWSKDEVKNGFLASKWCLDNHRFAQSLTFAQESAIGYYYNIFEWNKKEFDSIDKKDRRGAVTFILKIKSKQKDPKTKEVYTKNDFRHSSQNVIDWFNKSADSALEKLNNDELVNDFFKLEKWRNMVNHTKQGDRKNMQEEFPNILNKFIDILIKEE